MSDAVRIIGRRMEGDREVTGNSLKDLLRKRRDIGS